MSKKFFISTLKKDSDIKGWCMSETIVFGLFNSKQIKGPDGTYKINFNGIAPKLEWNSNNELSIETTHYMWNIITPDGSIIRPKQSDF